MTNWHSPRTIKERSTETGDGLWMPGSFLALATRVEGPFKYGRQIFHVNRNKAHVPAGFYVVEKSYDDGEVLGVVIGPFRTIRTARIETTYEK